MKKPSTFTRLPFLREDCLVIVLDPALEALDGRRGNLHATLLLSGLDGYTKASEAAFLKVSNFCVLADKTYYCEIVTDDIKIKKTVSHKTDNIKKACVNIAKNPIIIGIVLGFISSMLGMKYPVIVNKTIESIAQTATPIALICIGAGFEGRKAIKKLKPTLAATFIKLIGLAAVFIPVGVALGFRNQELVAALIMLASPTTVTSYVMAKSMDNDEVLSSSIIVLTTVLSSITLTGWIFILRALGLI